MWAVKKRTVKYFFQMATSSDNCHNNTLIDVNQANFRTSALPPKHSRTCSQSDASPSLITLEEASASIGRSGIKGLRGSTPPGSGSGGKFSFGKGLMPRGKNSPSSLLRHQCQQVFGNASSGLPHHSGGGTPSLFLGGGGGRKGHMSRHDSPRGNTGQLDLHDDTMSVADSDDPHTQCDTDLDLRRDSPEAIEAVIMSG